MSGLFGMLSNTARSLEAQRYGLDVRDVRPAGDGTPFANILLVARKIQS